MKKTTSPIRILHLEDNEQDAELMALQLRRANMEVTIKVIDSQTQYVDALRQFAPDVILSDHSLPSFSSIDALDILKASGLNIPFLLLSGVIPDALAAKAMSNGACGCLLKDELERLPSAILNVMKEKGNGVAREAYLAEECKKQYYEFVRDLPAAVYMCDVNGRLLLYNKAAVEIWGREPAGDQTFWCGSLKMYTANGKLIHHEQSPVAMAINQRKGGQREELIIERPDGTRRCVVSSPVLRYDDSGDVIGAINVLTDITDRKETEVTALVLADLLQRKNRELGRFTYTISHILRAPLARILGLTSLFGNDSSENKFIINKISEEALNLDLVVREMNVMLGAVADEG